jgi:hypothetical protein
MAHAWAECPAYGAGDEEIGTPFLQATLEERANTCPHPWWRYSGGDETHVHSIVGFVLVSAFDGGMNVVQAANKRPNVRN